MLLFNQMLSEGLWELAVQLNNTLEFTEDITYFTEQAVQNCQNSGK